MNRENNYPKTQEKDSIHISVTYGYKPLIDCMKNIITRRVSEKTYK